MKFNVALFCFSALLTFSLSTIIARYGTPPFFPTIISAIDPQNHSNQLGILSRILKLSGAEDFVSLVLTSVTRRHHHYHKQKCDSTKWDSKLIVDYNVSLVLTVDLNGCGKFSSVQKAVDAVPESSPGRTLIIIDSGTYRFDVCLSWSQISQFLSHFKYLIMVLIN